MTVIPAMRGKDVILECPWFLDEQEVIDLFRNVWRNYPVLLKTLTGGNH